MYQHKPRRFRHRSNGRSYQTRNKESAIVRLESGIFSNGGLKNNFKTHQSAEKLAEKYNVLAKEALTSGDKILSENYFQHAEHFSRIIDGKNQNRVQISSTPKESSNNLVKNTNSVQEQEKQEQEKKEHEKKE